MLNDARYGRFGGRTGCYDECFMQTIGFQGE